MIGEGTERRMDGGTEGGIEGGLIWPHGLRIIYIMAGRHGGENEISSCWPLVMLHPVPIQSPSRQEVNDTPRLFFFFFLAVQDPSQWRWHHPHSKGLFLPQ